MCPQITEITVKAPFVCCYQTMWAYQPRKVAIGAPKPGGAMIDPLRLSTHMIIVGLRV